MNPVQHILILAIKIYRWTVSPALSVIFAPHGGCRFEPSCSQYAIEAISVYGAIKGVYLAGRRLLRCHPWGGCGYDPVPPKQFTKTNNVLTVQSGSK